MDTNTPVENEHNDNSRHGVIVVKITSHSVIVIVIYKWKKGSNSNSNSNLLCNKPERCRLTYRVLQVA